MKAAEDFAQALRRLLEMVGRLEGSAHRLKEAFLIDDIQGINRARLDQEKLLAELERVPFRASFEELRKSLPVSPGGGMDDYLADRPELAGLWRDLEAGFARLREITITNRVLATRAVTFCRKVIGILQPDRRAGTYADSGRLRETHTPVISRVV